MRDHTEERNANKNNSQGFFTNAKFVIEIYSIYSYTHTTACSINMYVWESVLTQSWRSFRSLSLWSCCCCCCDCIIVCSLSHTQPQWESDEHIHIGSAHLLRWAPWRRRTTTTKATGQSQDADRPKKGARKWRDVAQTAIASQLAHAHTRKHTLTNTKTAWELFHDCAAQIMGYQIATYKRQVYRLHGSERLSSA